MCWARREPPPLARHAAAGAGRPIARRMQRPPTARQRSHRFIAADRDAEKVTELPCLLQIAHVADMEEVEAAVGQNHPLPGLPNLFRAPAQLCE